MKTINTLISIILITLAHAEDPPKNSKLLFVDFYRDWCSLAEEFPDDQEVKVMIVDLNQDGISEVLATSKGSEYEDGSAWTAFRQETDKWMPIRGFDATANKSKQYATLFGRTGEFFKITKNGDEVEFCILSENYDKLAPQGKGDLRKTRFYLDSKNILYQNNIPNLERYLAYQTSGHKWPDNSLINSLVRIEVEVFAQNAENE